MHVRYAFKGNSTRAWRDVGHQRYVTADKSGNCAWCACEVCVWPNLGPAAFQACADVSNTFGKFVHCTLLQVTSSVNYELAIYCDRHVFMSTTNRFRALITAQQNTSFPNRVRLCSIEQICQGANCVKRFEQSWELKLLNTALDLRLLHRKTNLCY